jgi:hypothetical protein
MAIQNNFPNIRPTLNLNFALSKRVDPRITFVRSTTATYFDQDGILQTAAANQGRITFDPATLDCQGLLIEEQRTNSIRNNTMQGAVAGTPGTAPTNWLVDTTGGVFTRTISGPSTESGITYIDIQVQASAGGTFVIRPEPGTQVAASVGQVWANTAYVKLAAGSLTNAACSIRIRENDSGGSILSEGTVNFTPTSAGLATQRVSITRTLASATVAFIQPRIEIIFSGAGDLTLRIGLPQLEQGAFATSVIPTTTTALTRNADVASMTGTNFSSWYNASEGTLFTSAAGVANVSGATRRYAEINDSGSLERIIVGYSGTTSTRLLVQDGGATQADIAVTTPSVENVIKMAAVYKTNDFQQASNGNLGLADTSGTLPTVDRMFIGSADGLTANTFLNGTIQRIAYYPVRVTDAQLQALTG